MIVLGGLLSLKLASNMLQSFCIIVAISEFKVGYYMLGYLITVNHNNLIAFEMFFVSECSPTMYDLTIKMDRSFEGTRENRDI